LTFENIGLEPFELLGLKVIPIRLLHGKMPVLGFRINDVAFCTDVSEIPEESWEKLAGLETLIIDALRDEPHPTHFSVDQSLEAIAKLKPKRAYLTHISHSLDHRELNDRLPDHIEPAYDGLQIDLT
jgi:phosphoribosyl 1,2-cyclic phosphate phosphodiesterase